MGTATTNRNPTDIVFTNEGTWASIVSTLRTYFVAGNTIQAAHLTYLKDRINEMLGHYHTYDDARQLHTYGAPYGDGSGGGRAPDYTNTGQGANYFVSGGRNTSRSSDFSPNSSSTYSTGSTITAENFNDLALRSRQLVSHSHPIVDATDLAA